MQTRCCSPFKCSREKRKRIPSLASPRASLGALKLAELVGKCPQVTAMSGMTQRLPCGHEMRLLCNLHLVSETHALV